MYVGVTSKDVMVRWKGHVRVGLKSCARRTRIAMAIYQFGPESFSIECVALGLQKDAAYALEAALIARHQSNHEQYGYNMSTGGEKSRLGCRHDDRTKALLSAARKGKPSPRKGVSASPESRMKMSIAHMGKPSPNKGKPRPPEVRAKISAAQLANPKPPQVWSMQRRERLHQSRGGSALGAHLAKGSYRARICIKGKVIYLGSFKSAQEAKAAYLLALRTYEIG